ncbi:4876_t:CDS:1, partial [Racocetra fulgida]
ATAAATHTQRTYPEYSENVANLSDLDVNSLQIVHNQLSRNLENVCRPDRNF